MTTQITLNLEQGALRFNFSHQAALELKAALSETMHLLKQKATQTGEPTRQSPVQPMEYQHTGDIFLEVFCNPNIWASPFAAKVLVTLRDERIRITTEAEMNQLYEDVTHYLEQ